jgi:hypothetical protein
MVEPKPGYMFFPTPEVLATNFLYLAVMNEMLIPIEFVNVFEEDVILPIAMEDITSQFPITNNRICDSYYFIVSCMPRLSENKRKWHFIMLQFLLREWLLAGKEVGEDEMTCVGSGWLSNKSSI